MESSDSEEVDEILNTFSSDFQTEGRNLKHGPNGIDRDASQDTVYVTVLLTKPPLQAAWSSINIHIMGYDLCLHGGRKPK